jgi:hydroxymethylpyrimidine/phosphomethylpyrimidine kinase
LCFVVFGVKYGLWRGEKAHSKMTFGGVEGRRLTAAFGSDRVPVMSEAPPIVLSIAGFDPSSGAGITADIKTITAHGCYGVSAITALTVQSTAGVRRVAAVDAKLLVDSLEELRRDVKVSAVHIGMLGNGEVAGVVADFLERFRPPNVVLDPVLKSSSGSSLLDESGIGVLTRRLFPLADLITPNVDEAAALTGMEVGNSEQIRRAAKKLHELGAKAVVVTGGHLDSAIDVLSVAAEVQTFRAERVDSRNTHGTGCAFSTAVACQLAMGRGLTLAVLLAKAYVLGAVRNSYAIGSGRGPVNHVYGMRNRTGPRAD